MKRYVRVEVLFNMSQEKINFQIMILCLVLDDLQEKVEVSMTSVISLYNVTIGITLTYHVTYIYHINK